MSARSRSLLAVTVILLAIAPSSLRVFASPQILSPTNATVAVKKTKYLLITLTTADGRLRGGENGFCIVFESRQTRAPAQVQSVSVNFTLLVGKIEERPIEAEIKGSLPGQFCGRVDLGKQYYVPAGYYVFLKYLDATGKRRKQRLFARVG